MNPKISVIVCVYNGQQFLSACIDSILKQNYRDFELIVVNDGSTDRSYEIALAYQQQDERLKLINQTHQGIGAARNTGLNIARGKYITFIDSDDWVSNAYLSRLLKPMQDQQVDIVISHFCEYMQAQESVSFFGSTKELLELERIYTPAEWVKERLNSAFSMNYAVAWGKLFRKRVFKGIHFPTDHKVGEDEATLWKVYLQAQRIYFSRIADYIYRKYRQSLTGKLSIAEIYAYSLDSLIDQIGTMKMLGIDTSSIEDIYVQRLRLVQEQTLKNGNYQLYKDVCFRLRLLSK